MDSWNHPGNTEKTKTGVSFKSITNIMGPKAVLFQVLLKKQTFRVLKPLPPTQYHLLDTFSHFYSYNKPHIVLQRAIVRST